MNYKATRDNIVFKFEKNNLPKTIQLTDSVKAKFMQELAKEITDNFVNILVVGEACKEISSGDSVMLNSPNAVVVFELDGSLYGSTSEFNVIGKKC